MDSDGVGELEHRGVVVAAKLVHPELVGGSLLGRELHFQPVERDVLATTLERSGDDADLAVRDVLQYTGQLRVVVPAGLIADVDDLVAVDDLFRPGRLRDPPRVAVLVPGQREHALAVGPLQHPVELAHPARRRANRGKDLPGLGPSGGADIEVHVIAGLGPAVGQLEAAGIVGRGHLR